jgi:hypothetical protein
MCTNCGHNVIGRTSLAAMATSLAALAFAVPASAKITDFPVGVPNCPQPQTQVCQPIVSVYVTTQGPLLVEFTAGQSQCSLMVAHIFVDRREWGSHVVGPGERDGGYYIDVSPGEHEVGVQAEGIEGGCNKGYVTSWAGTLRVETDNDAVNGRD